MSGEQEFEQRSVEHRRARPVDHDDVRGAARVNDPLGDDPLARNRPAACPAASPPSTAPAAPPAAPPAPEHFAACRCRRCSSRRRDPSRTSRRTARAPPGLRAAGCRDSCRAHMSSRGVYFSSQARSSSARVWLNSVSDTSVPLTTSTPSQNHRKILTCRRCISVRRAARARGARTDSRCRARP